MGRPRGLGHAPGSSFPNPVLPLPFGLRLGHASPPAPVRSFRKAQAHSSRLLTFLGMDWRFFPVAIDMMELCGGFPNREMLESRDWVKASDALTTPHPHSHVGGLWGVLRMRSGLVSRRVRQRKSHKFLCQRRKSTQHWGHLGMSQPHLSG